MFCPRMLKSFYISSLKNRRDQNLRFLGDIFPNRRTFISARLQRFFCPFHFILRYSNKKPLLCAMNDPLARKIPESGQNVNFRSSQSQKYAVNVKSQEHPEQKMFRKMFRKSARHAPAWRHRIRGVDDSGRAGRMIKRFIAA